MNKCSDQLIQSVDQQKYKPKTQNNTEIYNLIYPACSHRRDFTNSSNKYQ
ncbi:hypothetical protein HanPSC8_Chr13g0591591 [Helianthus annuus]|nr:hypothetical protein HanPSC8_Chr13g0591591 [Helianthus annuus]